MEQQNDLGKFLMGSIEQKEATETFTGDLSHTLKVLAPITQAASRHINPLTDPDALETVLSGAIKKAYTDTDYLLSVIDIKNPTSWLSAQIRGTLIREVIAPAIARNNGLVLEPKNQDYLLPIIDHVYGVINEEPTNEKILLFREPKYNHDAAIACATANLLLEYKQFDYMKGQTYEVAEKVKKTIKAKTEATIEGLKAITPINDDDAYATGAWLAKRAGQLLAEAWASEIEPTMVYLKSPEYQQSNDKPLTGLPLHLVFEEFDRLYECMERSVLHSFRLMLNDKDLQAINNNPVNSTASSAVRTASHGVKIIAPIIEASTQLSASNPDSDSTLKNLLQVTIDKAMRDSSKLMSDCGIEAQYAPVWLHSQVRGELTCLMAAPVGNALNENQDVNEQGYLRAISQQIQDAQEVTADPMENHIHGFQMHMGAALADSVFRVMREYEQFNYFHVDANTMAERITNLIKLEAFDQMVIPLAQQYGFTKDDVMYMGNTTLHHAGNILASCWVSNLPEVSRKMHEMPVTERRTLAANGYPMADVFNQFTDSMAGVNQALTSAMTHTLEQAQAPVQEEKKSAESSMSMGM